MIRRTGVNMLGGASDIGGGVGGGLRSPIGLDVVGAAGCLTGVSENKHTHAYCVLAVSTIREVVQQHR